MSTLIVPRPSTSIGASSAKANAGTFRKVTETHLPSRHSARMSTGPAGMSSRNRVSGSTIGIAPVSSSTVAMHIVLEPDIGGYSVGSMMIAPAAQSSRVDGTIKLTWRATEPRGSQINRRRTSSCSRSKASFLSIIVAPGGGRTPPVITSPCSPSAWQPITVMTRDAAIRYSTSALAEGDLQPVEVGRAEHHPVVGGDVDEVDVDTSLGNGPRQIG